MGGGRGETLDLAPEMVTARRRVLGGGVGEDDLRPESGDGVSTEGGLAGRLGSGQGPS